jgi:hypothetical protein
VSGEVEIGPTLREFKSFTAEFPPDVRPPSNFNPDDIQLQP